MLLFLINQKYVSWWPQGHNLQQSFNSCALHHKMSQDVKAEYGERAAFTSAPLKGVHESAWKNGRTLLYRLFRLCELNSNV